jgi:trans-aconitate 2-methyltransferase
LVDSSHLVVDIWRAEEVPRLSYDRRAQGSGHNPMKWNPEDYAQNSEAQLKWAKELRAELNLHGDESVLDVGCGDGKITADFAGAVGRAIGIDSSPEMIAYANEHYGSIANLTFDCGDARTINFTNEFDLIFSNAALHWMDNHLAFLQGAHRALRQGGRLITSCGGEGNAADVMQVFAELIAENSWCQYFQDFQMPYFFYGIQDYEPWLAQAGFETKRLELVPKDMTHGGREGLASWIRTAWLPFTDRVREGDRHRFIQEFVEQYLDRVPLDIEGLAHVAMVRLEVDAIKA